MDNYVTDSDSDTNISMKSSNKTVTKTVAKKKVSKQYYYAIHKGKKKGIVNTWDECKVLIKGVRGAVYKKFNNREEAEHFVKYGRLAEATILNDDNFTPDITVYTDGACYNNGKRNAKASIGVYFGNHDPRNVSRRIIGKQTNNTAELSAIIEAYTILLTEIEAGQNIAIYSDSMYAMRCCTSYGDKFYKKGWKKPRTKRNGVMVEKHIPNFELMRTAFELFHNKDNIRLIYIKAHTGKTDVHSLGNEAADRLATTAL
jgi:ribonuclease HI